MIRPRIEPNLTGSSLEQSVERLLIQAGYDAVPSAALFFALRDMEHASALQDATSTACGAPLISSCTIRVSGRSRWLSNANGRRLVGLSMKSSRSRSCPSMRTAIPLSLSCTAAATELARNSGYADKQARIDCAMCSI